MNFALCVIHAVTMSSALVLLPKALLPLLNIYVILVIQNVDPEIASYGVIITSSNPDD
jgi:hypothetical protein